MPLVAVTAAAVLADAVTRHDTIASMDGLTLLIAFDGLHLVLFLAFAFVAMAVRRHPALHRSLILLATINLLPPALGRLFAQTVIPHVELLVLGTIALLTVALVGLEWARSRYVRTEVIGAAGLTVAASLASWWAQTSA